MHGPQVWQLAKLGSAVFKIQSTLTPPACMWGMLHLHIQMVGEITQTRAVGGAPLPRPAAAMTVFRTTLRLILRRFSRWKHILSRDPVWAVERARVLKTARKLTAVIIVGSVRLLEAIPPSCELV